MTVLRLRQERVELGYQAAASMIAARRDQRERVTRACQFHIRSNPQQCTKIREIERAPDVIAREHLEREQMTNASNAECGA